MKWLHDPQLGPKCGSQKTVVEFLWFPSKFYLPDGKTLWVWLERVSLTYTYKWATKYSYTLVWHRDTTTTLEDLYAHKNKSQRTSLAYCNNSNNHSQLCNDS